MTIAADQPIADRYPSRVLRVLRVLVVAGLAAAAWGAWLQPARLDDGPVSLLDRVVHPYDTNDHLGGRRQAESITLAADGRVALAIMNSRHGRYDSDVKLYRSGDGGARWAPLATPAGIVPHQVALSADGRRIVMLGREGEIVRSGDGGASWATYRSGMLAAPSMAPALETVTLSADGLRVFVQARRTHGTHVMLSSDDGGATWREQPWDLGPIALSADGRSALRWVASPAIGRSDDGGRTWTTHALAGGRAVSAFALSADGRVGLAITPGGLWRSDDGGQTWLRSAVQLGDPIFVRIVLSADGQRGIALAHDGGRQVLHLTQDGGRTWVTSDVRRWEFESYWNVALAADGLRGIMVGHGSQPVLRTDDGGLSWRRVEAPGRSVPYWAYGALAISLASIAALVLAARRRAAA